MAVAARVVPMLLAEVTTPEWHPRPGAELPVYGYLVMHADGPMLVDSGLGPAHERIDGWYRPRRHDLAARLGEHGVAPGDVRALLCSHLHFDHCGGNALFPGVPVYVQRREHEASREAGYTVREWVDFEGADYRLLDGDAEVAAGVRVLAAVGHTPGHQAVLVETDEGAVLLAGQAADTYDEWRTGEVDAERAPALARLRALGAVRVYLSHEHPQD